MIQRPHLSAIVAVAIVVFTGLIWLRGHAVSIDWLGALGGTITVVGLGMAAFNFRLWRLPFLQGWFVKRPHLWGRWAVSIKSDWVDPETHQPREPVDAVLIVRQTFAAISIRMESRQSDGELLSAHLVPRDGGGFRLIGTYRNEPRLAERSRSGIHYGTFLLDVEGEPNHPSRMRGHYWTDRGTKGEMVAVRAGV